MDPLMGRHQTQRCTVLLGYFFAINARSNHGQFIGGLGNGKAFDIGPRIPELTLTGRYLLIEEGFHDNVFGARFRTRVVEQGLHREMT